MGTYLSFLFFLGIIVQTTKTTYEMNKKLKSDAISIAIIRNINYSNVAQLFFRRNACCYGFK